MAMPAPVSSAYCVPHQAQFKIDIGRVGWLSNFSIKDAQGTLVFDVKSGSQLALHTTLMLCDTSGNVLVLLKKKIVTMHKRWSAYRGDNDNDNNLLFTFSKSAYCQWTPSFDIFLPSNQTSMPDFVVKGNYKKYNYDVLFNGAPIVEARKKTKKSWSIGKNRSQEVTLYPRVDQGFIATIVAIMDQVKRDSERSGSGGHGHGGGGHGGGGGCGGGGGGGGGGGCGGY